MNKKTSYPSTVGDLKIGDKIFTVFCSDSYIDDRFTENIITGLTEATSETVEIFISGIGKPISYVELNKKDYVSYHRDRGYFINKNEAQRVYDFYKMKIINTLLDEIEERKAQIKELRKPVRVKLRK